MPPDQRVIIADDQLLVRAGIAALLAEVHGFSCVAAVADGGAALAACAHHAPDILLLDMLMPGQDGLTVTAALNRLQPAINVLILSSCTDAGTARKALAAGAKGYVSKDFVLDELALALRAVAAGRVYLSPEVSLGVMQSQAEPESALTPKQTDVLRGIAMGRSNKEIARDMGISLKTVAYHRAELISRLDLHDVASLTRFAIRQGLLG
jgi:DNA-binding NarL/FixJ family response regulator